MRIYVVVGMFLVVLLSGLGARAGEKYQSLKLVAPVGDAEAGRQAFSQLYCAACHRVLRDESSPAPYADNLGPDLGETDKSASEVASAIIAPSHFISEDVRSTLEGNLSPMGDFSEAMTLRQLIDIVAYLRSGGGDTEATSPGEGSPPPPVH